jgi:23S rRNA pseudouridine2605 synthase
LLTNDGDLAYKLTHPSHGVDKKYIARLAGNISSEDIELLQNGVRIEEYITSRAIVKVLESNGNSCRIEITIHEGKNRQVRKMFEALGKTVLSLKRVEFGGLNLEELSEGRWRYLNEKEVLHLKSL